MANNTEITINSKLRELRTNKDMTQQNLADRVGVSRQTIISIEQGSYVPSVLLAIKIANIMETAVEDVFYLTSVNE